MSGKLEEVRARLNAGFIAGLEARAGAMAAALEAGEVDTLRRLAHQLSGSGGSYGHMRLSELSRALEHAEEAALAQCLEALMAEIQALRGS